MRVARGGLSKKLTNLTTNQKYSTSGAAQRRLFLPPPQSLREEDSSVLKDEINQSLFNDKKFCRECVKVRSINFFSDTVSYA